MIVNGAYLVHWTNWHSACFLCFLDYQAVGTASQCDSTCEIHFTQQIGVKHLGNSPTN